MTFPGQSALFQGFFTVFATYPFCEHDENRSLVSFALFQTNSPIDIITVKGRVHKGFDGLAKNPRGRLKIVAFLCLFLVLIFFFL